MFDGDVGSCVSDVYVGCGRGGWVRVLLKLAILYGIVTFCCWEELRYRRSSVELAAQVELIRTAPKNRGLQVRYSFSDPQTGMRRINTVGIPRHQRPSGEKVRIQYLGGDFPQSRLAVQQRPYIISIYVWTHVLIAAIAAGYLGYLAWEANYRPFSNLSPQQRGIERFKRRRAIEREWRGSRRAAR